MFKVFFTYVPKARVIASFELLLIVIVYNKKIISRIHERFQHEVA